MLALALVLAGFYLTLVIPMRLAPDPELGPVALLVALGLLVGVVARRADPLMAPGAIAAGSLAALAFSLVLQSLVGQTSAMDPGAWRSALLLVLVVPPAVLASVIALVAVATRRTIRSSVIGLAAALAITAGSVIALGSFAAATDLTIRGDEQVLTITLRDDAILFDPPQVDAGIVTIVNIDETTQPRSLEPLGPIDEAELDRLRVSIVAVPPEPGLDGPLGRPRPPERLLPGGPPAWPKRLARARLHTRVRDDARCGGRHARRPPRSRRLSDPRGRPPPWRALRDLRRGPPQSTHSASFALWLRRTARTGTRSLTSRASLLAAGALALPLVWVWLAFEFARNPF